MGREVRRVTKDWEHPKVCWETTMTYEEKKMSDCIELACIVLRETPKALLCAFGDREHWIPKSQIHDDSEVWKVGDRGTIKVSEWIVTEKGLV